jgi:hypothetical protein
MREKALYKDINQFTPTVNPYAIDANAVFQSVINVVRTAFMEIPFSPKGVDLELYLFELYDQSEADTILIRLTSAIEGEEDRVAIDTTQSSIRFVEDRKALEISLVFEIEGIDNQKFEINESIPV